MPTVLIEVRQRYTPQQEIAMIEAVHRALLQAFKLPPEDRDVRLLVHEPHRFVCPPDKARPECFTAISIDAFPGRSLAAKRDLYRGIVAGLEPLGIPGDHVRIVLREIGRENWGIRGGQAACDVELGFKVDV